MKRVKQRNKIAPSMWWSSIVLFVIWMLFFLNKDFVLNSDLRLHYEFALQLPSVLRIGLKAFEQQVKYARAISYPAWHIFFLIVYEIFSIISDRLGFTDNVETLSLLSQAVVNSALLLFCFWIIFYVYKRYYKMEKKWAQIFAVAIMFVGPIYFPLVHKSYYIGQFTANPWHNPTSFAVKPIAVVTFFLYCWIYNQHNKVIKKDKRMENLSLSIFSLCLFVSGYLKPNFYQVFVPALFAFCVIDVFRTKFKSFIFCLKTGIAVLPVCIMALLQYMISFTAVGNKVMLRPFQVWSHFTPNILGSFIISMAFPIASYSLGGRLKKRAKEDAAFPLSILFFLSAVSQFILFSFEEGWTSGDFVWGVYLATLIIFIVESSNNIKKCIRKEDVNIKTAIVFILFGLHVLCGIGYFCACYIFDSFYI